MSGPFIPPANAQTANGQRRPMMLPPGQTYKPWGADRVPQGTGIPQRSDGSNRVRAANQAGVRPEQLTQPPGYRPPQGNISPGWPPKNFIYTEATGPSGQDTTSTCASTGVAKTSSPSDNRTIAGSPANGRPEL